MFDPPFVERAIQADEETLFRGRSFGKSIRDVSTKDEKVFSGRDSIEQAGTRLIDTICICFRKDTDHARTSVTITYALSLFAAIDSFYGICPHEMEDSVVVGWSDGIAKHPLRIILVQLKVFRFLPVGPVLLL
jgi:hypothetical protein